VLFRSWEARDVIWGLWGSSLVVGYITIMADIGVMVFTGQAYSWIPKAFFGAFLLCFVTCHFGGFHFVHSIFLNEFFPIVKFDRPGQPDPSAMLLLLTTVLLSYWPMIAVSLASRFADIRRGADGSGNIANPYLNVVRMHILIFVFAGLYAAHLTRFAIYPVLVFYFFPWGDLFRNVDTPTEARKRASPAEAEQQTIGQRHVVNLLVSGGIAALVLLAAPVLLGFKFVSLANDPPEAPPVQVAGNPSAPGPATAKQTSSRPSAPARPASISHPRTLPPGIMPPQLLALKAGDRIAFFGDAITTDGGNAYGYARLVAQAIRDTRPDLRIQVIVAGAPEHGSTGGTVPDLQTRLDQYVLAKKATVVVIYAGTYDVRRQTPSGTGGSSPEQYEAGLRDLIRRITAAKARAMLCTPTVIGERTDGKNPHDKTLEEYCAISRRVASETDTPLVDLHRAFVDYLKVNNGDDQARGILTRDGVNLNGEGHRLVADLLLAAFGVSAGSEPGRP
jgi:isoamyl acetate esterase